MGALTPTEPGWPASGLLRARAKRTIAASPEAIWALVSDPARWSSWFTAHSEFRVVGDAPLGPGARIAIREWRFRYEGEVNEWDPDRTLGWTYTASSFSWMLTSNAERLTIEPTDEGTLVTLEGRFSLNVLGWILAPYSLSQILGLMWSDFHDAVKAIDQLLGTET